MIRMQLVQVVVASLAVVFGSVGTLPAWAQSFAHPEIEWEQTFGNINSSITSVVSLSDGSFVVAGGAVCSAGEDECLYLVKLNAEHDVIWERFYGSGEPNHGQIAFDLQETSDGGFIVCGSTATEENIQSLVARTNARGILQWSRTYSNGEYAIGRAIRQTPDGGFIMVGCYDCVGGHGSSGSLLRRLDSSGEVTWERGFGAVQLQGVLSLDDGGCMGVGVSSGGVYIVSVNADGDLLREQTYDDLLPTGDERIIWGENITAMDDGGFVVVATIAGGPSGDVFVFKINATGEVEWQQTFGHSDYFDQGLTIQRVADGGIVVSGVTQFQPVGNPSIRRSVHLLKLDVQGSLLWEGWYGDLITAGRHIVHPESEGYVVLGTKPVPPSQNIPWIAKLATERPLPPPQPPTGVRVSYSNFTRTATVAWLPNTPRVERYIVERKLGCDPWKTLNAAVSADDTMYADDDVSPATSVCYQVSAANSAGVSNPSEKVCLVVPTEERWHLKLYDPDAPNPNSDEPGAWVNCYPCDYRFHKGRGTAVIVHGWNPPSDFRLLCIPVLEVGICHWDGDLNSNRDGDSFWVLEMAQLLSGRFNHNINVVAWDWLPEAEGTLGDVIERVGTQAKNLANGIKAVLPNDYRQPIHLMGHSLGSLVAAETCLELVEPRRSIPGTFRPQQVTLWDPPDVLVKSNLNTLVSEIRDREIYVDLYNGITNIGTHGVNLWINVPGLPHGTYHWYQGTIPAGSDPVLYQYKEEKFCYVEPLLTGGSIGFGASALLLGLTSRPDPKDCPSGTLRFGLRSYCPYDFDNPGDHYVYLGSSGCEGVPPPAEVTLHELTGGDYWLSEGWQCNCGYVNSTEMFLGFQGRGEGGGAQATEPTVRYSLGLHIQSEWDYLSFEYDFTEVVADATLEATLTVGDMLRPVFLMTSEPVVPEEFLDTGLRDIRQLHGKEVMLTFELRSAQPGATVHIRNLTFWRDPWNGNRPPVADAGGDQEVAGRGDGIASVTLDGSRTTDADGDELTYWWLMERGILATGVNPTVELTTGTYEITLVVRDVADQVSTDTLRVIARGGFLRGDSNFDGTVDISDAINTLGFLFLGSSKVSCQDSADANDDGVVDISDAITTLGFLFLGLPQQMLAPYPARGADPTFDDLDCKQL